MAENRLAKLSREYSHKGTGYIPSQQDIKYAIDVGMGRMPYDVAYGEKPLQGGFDIGEVGGVPINATDVIPADMGANALMKLAALGKGVMAAKMLPIFAGGMIKGIGGRMPETADEINKLASMMERHAKNAGTDVSVGYSNISPSTYLRFNRGEELPLAEVRISNHPDRYIGNAEGERISVHPGGAGYEEAIDWLKDRGIKLSNRSKKIENKPYTIAGFEGVKASDLLKLRKSRNPAAVITPEDFNMMPGLIDDLGITNLK